MAEKIGFIKFTLMDSPSPTDYAAYDKLERRQEPDGHVKSLAETHPLLPPTRTEPKGLNRTPDTRLYKLAAELAPYMDEFHSRALDHARINAQLDMIERTRMQNDRAELKYFRQVDLLHAWITELLFERVYRRVGRAQALFQKIALREWMETENWNQMVREQRLDDSRIYPDLHKKELVHPYRFEIKMPNEKKSFEQTADHIRSERHIVEQAKVHAHQLRQVLHDIIFENVRLNLQQQSMIRRHQDDRRDHWHMHDVMRAFDKAWMHAWDSRDTFRELVRSGIFQQAELYPRLFRKAIRDPYEIEIREPNEKDYHQKIQAHIDHERQELKLIKLGEEAGRQVTRNNKIELAAYRLVAAENIEEQRLNSQWQKHVLVERSDQLAIERREYIFDAKRVESQGYQLLAGRMIPQPKFAVDADLVTRVPLTLGLNGDPRAPEHVSPTPLMLVPQQQKDNWQKLRAIQHEEQRLDERNEVWQEKTQNIRQNLAVLEYGEQRTRELQRADVKPPTDSPIKPDAVEPVGRAEPIPDLKLSMTPDESKNIEKLTKPKE